MYNQYNSLPNWIKQYDIIDTEMKKDENNRKNWDRNLQILLDNKMIEESTYELAKAFEYEIRFLHILEFGVVDLFEKWMEND